MSRKGYKQKYEKDYFIPSNTNKTNGFLILTQDAANGKKTKVQSKKLKRKK